MKPKKPPNEQVTKFGAVMTPIWVVHQMLDMLDPAYWANPHIKFCEPSVGEGVFIDGLVHRLVAGLAAFEPNHKARYQWIFEHNIYAVDIQPHMIAGCIARFGIADMAHHFICDNFLTMDVKSWLHGANGQPGLVGSLGRSSRDAP
jgi:hypothetical protein